MSTHTVHNPWSGKHLADVGAADAVQGKKVLAGDPSQRTTVFGPMINPVPTLRVENMPYGGVKDSGIGREGVRHAMEEMTELRSLVINRA